MSTSRPDPAALTQLEQQIMAAVAARAAGTPPEAGAEVSPDS